jgi:anti-sigma regulatory factor (Ser/Thr protein kinase)
VATLLDVLLQSGETTAHMRVRKRLDLGSEGLSRSGPWLDEAAVLAAFTAAGNAPRLARRVGQALVRLEGLGPFLCHSGIATVEKAYRRSHQLLAREAEGARYAEPEIDGDRAVIRFEPAKASGGRARMGPGGQVFCEMRRGMLEALPMVFGLLPATVRETACAHRGAEICSFEVRWSRQARRGLLAGLALGLVGTGLALAWSRHGGPSAYWVAPIGFVATLLAMGAGRALDLSRQLEAVAGARRGQLALLDQVDQSLAEKLDELAKIGAAPIRAPLHAQVPARENEEGLVPVHRQRGQAGEQVSAAPRERLLLVDVARRAWAAAGGRRAGASDGNGRGERPDQWLRMNEGAESAWVRGDAMQLEFMIEQLVRNAIDASGGTTGVYLALARSASGVELTVADSGPGIEPEMLDETFDPFFEGTPDGVGGGGLGLPICYRIVSDHGGQLHLQSRPGAGTRICVQLPEASPD